MDSQVISSQVTDNTGLPEKDITASGGTISEEFLKGRNAGLYKSGFFEWSL